VNCKQDDRLRNEMKHLKGSYTYFYTIKVNQKINKNGCGWPGGFFAERMD